MPRPPRDDALALLRDELRIERERYDALLTRYDALKRDGFTATVQYDAPPPVPPFPGPVVAAIAQRSEPGTVERRELERHAADALRAGTGLEDVAKTILDGEDVGF